MAKFSVYLRNAMLNAIPSNMYNSQLRIFSGPAPASPDDAETGTLLMVLTSGGTGGGLGFDTPGNGILAKSPGDTWETSSILETGVCGYFRLVDESDDGSFDDSAFRIQGTCGVAGADMILVSTSVTQGDPFTLNYFNIALPSL